MANIFLDVEKGAEVAAEDLLHFFTKAQQLAPGAVAGLGVLAGAIDKAITDVEAGAANPTSLVLSLPADIADIKAVWPAIKAFFGTLGVKL